MAWVELTTRVGTFAPGNALSDFEGMPPRLADSGHIALMAGTLKIHGGAKPLMDHREVHGMTRAFDSDDMCLLGDEHGSPGDGLRHT